MQVQQEWMSLLIRNQEDPLFRARAFDLVILDDELLLQDFDGVELLGTLSLSQHDLSEVALSENCQKVEMVQSYSLSSALGVRRRSDLILWGFSSC